MKTVIFSFLLLLPTILFSQIYEEEIPMPELDFEMVFRVVEQMPEYPGGMEQLFSDISSNISITDKNCSSGKVYVEFIVDTLGIVRKPKILRGIDSCSNQAALHSVQKLKPFIPGMQRGKKVPVAYTIPINIHLDK